MQPSVKKIENAESAFPFRFVDSNTLGNTITVETAVGLSKRQLLVAMLLSAQVTNLLSNQRTIDLAYRVADMILVGPTDEKSLVDLDQIGQMDRED